MLARTDSDDASSRQEHKTNRGAEAEAKETGGMRT